VKKRLNDTRNKKIQRHGGRENYYYTSILLSFGNHLIYKNEAVMKIMPLLSITRDLRWNRNEKFSSSLHSSSTKSFFIGIHEDQQHSDSQCLRKEIKKRKALETRIRRRRRRRHFNL